MRVKKVGLGAEKVGLCVERNCMGSETVRGEKVRLCETVGEQVRLCRKQDCVEKIKLWEESQIVWQESQTVWEESQTVWGKSDCF
jgi:hypothetical protein